jgi:hypothetical protein
MCTFLTTIRRCKVKDNNNSGGIGFFGFLTILFIGLKLGNIIDWSWWWVLAPTWMSITLACVILFIYYLKRKGGAE